MKSIGLGLKFLLLFSFSSCKPKFQAESDIASYNPVQRNIEYHCRKDSHISNRICVKKNTAIGDVAIGPFPKSMLDGCLKKATDKSQCNEKWMPVNIAREVRGTKYCANGTSESRTLCQGKDGADKEYVFGPFAKAYVSRCHKLGFSAEMCLSMRWKVSDAQKIIFSATKNDLRPSRLADTKPQVSSNSIEKKLGKSYCERYWDTNYYADYTTVDHHYSPPRDLPQHMRDRELDQTLQGRADFSNPHPFLRSFDIGVATETTEADVCNNARVFYKCFKRSIDDDERTLGGGIFLRWARTQQKDPIRVKMAIAAQETNLGWWINQGTNGVGIMQLAQPLTLDGFSTYVEKLNSDEKEPLWRGITHNTLTNIRYGTHMLADKINQGIAGSLYDLAFHYNGSPHQVTYANNVLSYYETLGRCGL